MASFNQVTLLGNATRDPTTKTLPNGTDIAEWGIAVNRKFKTSNGEDREEVCFADCTAFGKLAGIVGKFITKGKQHFICGRLKFDQWEDKNGGGKRSKLSIIVDELQLLGSRQDATEGSSDDTPGTSGPPRGGYQSNRRPTSDPRDSMRLVPSDAPFDDGGGFEKDDVPFAWTGRSTEPL